MNKPYLILKEAVFFQEEIKKSRFLTFLQPAKGKAAAMQFLADIKAEHKDARHHCWAFIGGSPKDSVNMGCSDDGEPKGTAGKPMLAVLQGSHVGEMVAVVVRYSGGIKLGTGGLVRAYSNGLQQLCPTMPTMEKRFFEQFQLQCNYAQMATLEHILSAHSGRLIEVDYQQTVQALIEVDREQVSLFKQKLQSLMQGQVIAKKINRSVNELG
ncbi:YigZ family protein [Psychromonas sp. 14N.309.X.WAT.B.A12]|uniref:YigZ family protein n=1 Tax=unclassified Psychromonas TaxID=2614957 RepID=UPI0025B0195C|nr:YigZ family protein [Psychromonas sp. 14N.309.X.WAT.B.A12]MDN2664068.1 YigZ family protein [Psychromonas sp. 14N.309.X.WAT.B.A12]